VAEDCPGAGGEYCSHAVTVRGEVLVSHGIHAAIKLVKAAMGQPMLDRVRTYSSA
jgi:hypothetical protein